MDHDANKHIAQGGIRQSAEDVARITAQGVCDRLPFNQRQHSPYSSCSSISSAVSQWLSKGGHMTFLPPLKLQAITPQDFV